MPGLLLPSLLCHLLLLFPLASSSASNGDTVVITSSGPIKGKQLFAGLGSVTAYLGVPYAEPPLGKLRFQKPLPHRPWSQILEATSLGNSCPQFIFRDVPEAEVWYPKTPQSEDCLSLNIWAPYPQLSSGVPVLIWIHGGGFFIGTSSLDLYNGASLAATENVIVISMNYRLGSLGFLFLPPAAPGNMGLWDQQLALKWVKENAAAFGGDPSRVTIFGQSAGGSSVNFHLLSPKSQDLFAQAVIQSGTANAIWAWKTPEKAKQISLEFGHLLGCSEDHNTSMVSCLQTKNASEFIQRETSMYQEDGFLLNFPFTPTTDGDFLLGDPQNLMEEGQIQIKPVLIGRTPDEATSFVLLFFHDTNHSLINQEQFLKGIRLAVQNAPEDLVQAIALRYSEGNHGPAQYRSALSQFYTDYIITCSLIDSARNIRKTGSPVYAYLFTHRPSGSVWPEWIGAIHASEIAFIFGTLESALVVNQTEAETRLSRQMMHYWAEFARTGNPAGSAAPKVEWPLYNATEWNVFLLNTEPVQNTEEQPPRHCDFLKMHFSEAAQAPKSSHSPRGTNQDIS
ncbi:cholinesterase-like [Candoia aspera]|uniref:cholinesterase-like n=1 Tax=Candoia aspera TaxID=51853 RepID=UPI002FD7D991